MQQEHILPEVLVSLCLSLGPQIARGQLLGAHHDEISGLHLPAQHTGSQAIAATAAVRGRCGQVEAQTASPAAVLLPVLAKGREQCRLYGGSGRSEGRGRKREAPAMGGAESIGYGDTGLLTCHLVHGCCGRAAAAKVDTGAERDRPSPSRRPAASKRIRQGSRRRASSDLVEGAGAAWGATVAPTSAAHFSTPNLRDVHATTLREI
mmetsp:Transcript_98954/g.317298  ORF Transcript_98954/g.317298 Transcript_98954/m.317298 type:complete len:207 (-) Transcript_98954:445-1065(-)